jgi:hypothetical protein
MREGTWMQTGVGLPDRHREVEWLVPAANAVVRGVCLGYWEWLPNASDLYVCYSPRFWRYAD